MSRFYISATHKSSGKTTVSIGLCAALREKGNIVQAYKKGPDYIDPHWLARASGRDCFNLDFYTMAHDEIMRCIGRHSSDADVSMIEGNMGLYDGLDLDGSNSNAALASLSDTPVILVLDARGMTRGIAPLILGYQAFDENINIAGVILNQLGGHRHESKLRAVIEHYTDVKVIGAIQRDSRLDIDERHLGLVPSHEDPVADDKVTRLAAAINDQVDLDTLLSIADTAADTTAAIDIAQSPPAGIPTNRLRLGIAISEAFGFYYADDLNRFRELGVELVEIDLQNDPALPDIDGLFIGGGFPETHLSQLEANTAMRHAVADVIDNGLPVYAECGGLMYLSKSISWNGETHEMAGAIPGDIVMEAKPQGRGYVRLAVAADHPWDISERTGISAHEFHYSRFNKLDKDARFAYSVERGTGIDGDHDGYIRNNLLACYTHQRHTGSNPWVEQFTGFMRRIKDSYN